MANLPRDVQSYIDDKVHKIYHDNWKEIFIAMKEFHGRALTTNFEDIEKLKQINYLSMHLNLR